MRVWLAVVLLFVWVAGAAPALAHADDKPLSKKEANARAATVTADAKAAFQAKRYDAAADLFMQAYDLAKNPASVYNAARAKELGGKLDEAKAFYELYLRIEKSEAGRADATKRLFEIEAVLRKEAEDKAQAAAAKAREEVRLREQNEKMMRDAEAKVKAAEAKAQQAELHAQQEAAARQEAEQRARAEAEARGRAEAEAHAKAAEARATTAEAKLKEAEERARNGGVTPAKIGAGAVLVPPKPSEKPAVPPPEPEPPGNNALAGVLLSVDGGGHVQESAPDAHLRPDFTLGVGATGHVGVGPGRVPYVSLLAGLRWFTYTAFDGHADPKQAPSGLAWSLGLAFPRLAGLQAFVQRHLAKMDAGIGDFAYTTVGVRLVVAPRTGYLALGFEGLVASSRSTLDVSQTDELGYGPTARLFLEFGVNLANCGLSK